MKKDQIKNTNKQIDFKDYSTSIFTTNKNNKIIEILNNKKVITTTYVSLCTNRCCSNRSYFRKV